MSQFREIVENILQKHGYTLDEARIIQLKSYASEFNNQNPLVIIKNPSKTEYDNIKKNSKFNSIRGFVTEDDSVYVWDANLGIHQDIIDELEDNNKIPYDIITTFSEDEQDELFINGKYTSNLKNILNNKKPTESINTFTHNNIKDLNYYDFELLYNGIYKKENDIVEEMANSYSYKYDFDFSKLDYDNKPYKEKDDLQTFIKKAKQIIKNNINNQDLQIAEDTVKQGNSWTNKGKEGTHGTFKTKKQADDQRKAMFANGYKG